MSSEPPIRELASGGKDEISSNRGGDRLLVCRAFLLLHAVMTMNPYFAGPDSFVFFGEDAARPVGAHTLQRGLSEAIKASGISEKGSTFHCLRHTAASLIAGDAGMDRVQRLRGHTMATMTESYTHPTDNDRGIVRKAQDTLW